MSEVPYTHCLCCVWQGNVIATQTQLQQPPYMFTIQLQVHYITQYAHHHDNDDDDSTPLSQLQHTTIVQSFYVSRDQFLQSDYTARCVLSSIISHAEIIDIGHHHLQPLVEQFCTLARWLRSQATDSPGCTLLPIIVGVEFFTVWQPPLLLHDDTEAIAGAVRSTAAEMAPKPVPATKSSIEALEKMRFGDGNSDIGSLQQCMICLELFSAGVEVSRMPCSHVFHGDCIVQWLETSHLCPLCRFSLPC